MKNRAKKIFFLAGAAALFTLSSCSFKSHASAVISMLDEADRYIAQNNPSDALKILNAVQKKIVSPMEAIGIYRRYVLLSEKKSGEKVIVKNLKKHPKNLELNAIYTAILKDAGEYEKAFSQSEILRGTKYSSLYAEMYFRNLISQDGERNLDFFLGADFLPIYHGAWQTSHDNAWLRNEALAYLARGEFSAAAALVPETKKSGADAYFWAAVLYDGQKYEYAAESLLEANRLFARNENSFYEGIPDKTQVSAVEVASLLSDCYVRLGEDDVAENVRDDLIASLMLSGAEQDSSDLLARVYLNSALYSQERDNPQDAKKILDFVVEKWPDFSPALIAYGNFAYESARRVLDDPLTRALRDAGIVSADMKRFDELPRIPVSDALARMRESLERTGDKNLHVAILDLEDRISTSIDERARISKIWRLLEQNTLAPNLYPPEIVQYALHIFLEFEKYDEAKNVFVKYLNARFGFDEKEPFERELLKNIPKMDLWEIEYAAFFAASQNDSFLAKRLYERAVFGEKKSFENSFDAFEISPECDIQSAANLAMIYSSTGDKETALKLYGAAASRATDSYLKSEIMYRLGCTYNKLGQKSDARRSLEYGLYLNPGNGNARLLLGELKS